MRSLTDGLLFRKETLFSHDNILKLCDAPLYIGGEKEMSLHVRIAPDLGDEEHVRKGSKTMDGKNNNNTATHPTPNTQFLLVPTSDQGKFEKILSMFFAFTAYDNTESDHSSKLVDA